MSDEEVKSVSNAPLWVGVILTAVYLVAVYCVFHEKVSNLQLSSLNEAGDFSAGLFAPLAFLWLVVSLWMQRAELSQNTEVLKNQLQELKFTVKHQEDIAWATVAELNKEKPYLFVEGANLTYNEKDAEYHVHFVLRNTGGTLRQAEFEFNYSEITKTTSENEITEEENELCFRVSTTEADQLHFERSWEAVLKIQGLDIHRQDYKHKAVLLIDYPEFKKRTEIAKASQPKIVGMPVEQEIEVKNHFSNT